jgi:prepilin signal peptidase PulO-like enzyme (type II secretory pathway)
MNFMVIIFLAITLIAGIAIAYQDFRTRLISVWIIILFTVFNTGVYVSFYSFRHLFENSFFLVCYLALLFCVLQLYFYIKHKKFERIIDKSVGLGDVLLFIVIGCCLEPPVMIYFFTLSFIAGVLFYLFRKNTKTVPLAGITVLLYLIYEVAEIVLQ